MNTAIFCLPKAFRPLRSVLDIYRFMTESLGALALNLDLQKKLFTRKYCDNEKDFNLLQRKENFPYEYMNSWEILQESVLLAKECFHRKLSNTKIHAKLVWSIFKTKTFR